jgi:hypothetical protein
MASEISDRDRKALMPLLYLPIDSWIIGNINIFWRNRLQNPGCNLFGASIIEAKAENMNIPTTKRGKRSSAMSTINRSTQTNAIPYEALPQLARGIVDVLYQNERKHFKLEKRGAKSQDDFKIFYGIKPNANIITIWTNKHDSNGKIHIVVESPTNSWKKTGGVSFKYVEIEEQDFIKALLDAYDYIKEIQNERGHVENSEYKHQPHDAV